MKKEYYRFNKEGHKHEILVDGVWKSLTGCTTILSVLAKPALIKWAVGVSVDYIRDEIDKTINENLFVLPNLIDKLPFIYDNARKEHENKKNKAGNFGTELHKLIEDYIKKGNEVLLFGNNDLKVAYGNFIKWAKDNKVKFLEAEKNVYSKKLFIGGIIDIICEIDGQVWLVDLKTSNSGIWPENFAQMAGYQIMLQDMKLYPEITGYIVLNLKKNGEFMDKRSVSNEDNKKFFLACLEIYRQQERIKNQIL